MSDYIPVNDFSAKDSLTTGDPEKIILGSDMDAETAAIQTAVNTKYDSDDLASQAQAEAEASNVVLMTPLRVANWADYNAGMVGDIQALVDPNADRLLGWDDSAGAVIGFTVSGALAFSGTDLSVTAANLLTQLLTVDGAGSGLDADLLDGQSSGFYQTSTNQTAGTLPDARLSTNVPLLNAANVFTADQSITRATVPVLYLHNTLNNATDRAYTAFVSNSVARVYTGIGDLNGGMTRADYNIRIVAGDMTVSRDDGSTISFKVGSSLANSTINGVAFNDFARLSQTNTWTNAAQGISATNGAWSVTDTGVTSAHTANWIGTTSNHSFSIRTNNSNRVTVDNAGIITTNNTQAGEFGFKGTPQNTQTSTYTLALTDAGKTIKATSAATTITIPDDASVVFPDGTVIRIHNRTGSNITVTKTTSSGLVLNGSNGSTGARTLGNNSICEVYKSQGDEWIISGPVS